MPASADIAEARMLLERAERESDPEQETRHIEEALLLLETADDPTPQETRLIANLRLSYARRLLTQLPNLKSASFEVWLFYFNILVELTGEVEALTTADPALAANRQEFAAMWGPEMLPAVEGTAAVRSPRPTRPPSR
jgi:hypothetical protein